MDVNESRHGDTVILQPVGSIDTRSAFDLEQRLDELLGDGTSSFVIDFSEVGLLASSGIRVLLMLVKRLAAVGGSLALCHLTDYVKTVLDISGLAAQFPIAATREEALAMLQPLGVRKPPEAAAEAEPPSESVAPSEVCAVVSQLLLAGDVGGGRRRAAPRRVSRLTQEVERLMAARGPGDAEAHDS